MYERQEDVFYYLTVGNEAYPMPARPDHVSDEDITRGLYKFRASAKDDTKLRAQILASGAIMNEALEAQEMLADRFGVAADVWSAPSYTELRRDAIEVERWNTWHPGATARKPYVRACP